MFSWNKNSNLHRENLPSSEELMMKVFAAGLATLGAHPFRVLLNEASVTKNPCATLQAASYKMFRDAHINIARGTTSTALQLIAKHHINIFYGNDTYMGKAAGIIGAIAAGVIATPIEVAFMRRNASRTISSTHTKLPKFTVKSLLVKYNLPILVFFTARELGFCVSVFGTDGLPFYQKVPTLLPGALITAIAHKLVAVEITKDIRQIPSIVPDYSIGFRAVFRNIAYGDIYAHQSFKVPIKNPQKPSHLAINFFSATCGSNMYFWRLSYLAVFASLLSFVNQVLKDNHINASEENAALPMYGMRKRSQK